MAKMKYYVVWKGRQPGIYSSWEACQRQVNGFPDAKFKSYKTEAEAQAAFAAGWQATKKGPLPIDLPAEVIGDSLSVDAACEGNPGLLEYRGVHTQTGQQVFHVGPIENGTNNLGEFLAIVHALKLLKQEDQTCPIYSDSRTGIAWVTNREVRSALPRTPSTEAVWQLVDQALLWLSFNSYPNKIIKWKTEAWGEIRADFGRK